MQDGEPDPCLHFSRENRCACESDVIARTNRRRGVHAVTSPRIATSTAKKKPAEEGDLDEAGEEAFRDAQDARDALRALIDVCALAAHESHIDSILSRPPETFVDRKGLAGGRRQDGPPAEARARRCDSDSRGRALAEGRGEARTRLSISQAGASRAAPLDRGGRRPRLRDAGPGLRGRAGCGR